MRSHIGGFLNNLAASAVWTALTTGAVGAVVTGIAAAIPGVPPWAFMFAGLVAAVLVLEGLRGVRGRPRPIENQALRTPVTSTFQVRLRNAIEGEAADCSEAFFDCASLVITNNGPATKVSVGLRPDGTGTRVWLLRNSKEREFTIYSGESVSLPLLVRTRQPASWGTTNPRGVRVVLSPGPCYIFDEAFELSGTPNVVLQPGRHFLPIDVLPSDRASESVNFNVFIPKEPQKSLWFQMI